MVSFISKKIEDDDRSFGERLKIARDKKGLTLDQVCNILGINSEYLEAMEKNELEKLPEGLYRNKFLEKYAHFLGVNEGIAILELTNIKKIKEEKTSYQLPLEKDSFLKKVKIFILSRFFLKSIIATVVISLGVAYLYGIAYNIIKPPNLAISYPYDDFITREFSIGLNGQTDEDAKVFINDNEVFCSDEGFFGEEIDLSKGINIVKISAKKKYSKENIIYRKILVTEEEELSKK